MGDAHRGSRVEIETSLKQIIEWVGQALDVFGVAIIAIGMAYGAVRYAVELLRGKAADGYAAFRLYLVRALLLGLEVLVAADVIRTVAVSPSLNSVAVLAAIVAIRTFLSWSLILELEGRWPWQKSVVPPA